MKTKKKNFKKLVKSAKYELDTLSPSDVQKDIFKASYSKNLGVGNKLLRFEEGEFLDNLNMMLKRLESKS